MNSPRSAADTEALEARIGARIATGLALRAAEVPHDISERLRVARQQAVARARRPEARLAPASVLAGRTAGGAAVLGGPSPWWFKLAAGLPLLVLMLGLLGIGQLTQHEQVLAAAEIDAELLADDLPPAAYADPGFSEFLKAPPAQ